MNAAPPDGSGSWGGNCRNGTESRTLAVGKKSEGDRGRKATPIPIGGRWVTQWKKRAIFFFVLWNFTGLCAYPFARPRSKRVGQDYGFFMVRAILPIQVTSLQNKEF